MCSEKSQTTKKYAHTNYKSEGLKNKKLTLGQERLNTDFIDSACYFINTGLGCFFHPEMCGNIHIKFTYFSLKNHIYFSLVL